MLRSPGGTTPPIPPPILGGSRSPQTPSAPPRGVLVAVAHGSKDPRASATIAELAALARERERQAKTHAQVAATMGDSEGYVRELESEAGDAEISAVDRYAVALGYVVQYHLIPEQDAGQAPPVVVH